MAHLTDAQKATLKAYIIADPALGPKTSGVNTDYQGIAEAMSAPASPVQLAWVTNATSDASDDAPDYSTYDSLVAGKRDSWNLFLRTSRNFTRNKVRKWVTDVWGNATANSNAEAILQSATVNAKRIEVVLGGTLKTTGTVAALDRNYVGSMDLAHVADIFNV